MSDARPALVATWLSGAAWLPALARRVVVPIGLVSFICGAYWWRLCTGYWLSHQCMGTLADHLLQDMARVINGLLAVLDGVGTLETVVGVGLLLGALGAAWGRGDLQRLRAVEAPEAGPWYLARKLMVALALWGAMLGLIVVAVAAWTRWSQ